MHASKVKQFVSFKWGVTGVIAIASVMALASKASQGQNEFSSAALASAAAPADAGSQVVMDNYLFNPATLTIKVGTTVTWINHDDDPHTVDSTQGKFKSSTLNKGDKFEFRFTEAGEYPFYCRFHPKMTGKIIVQP